MLPWLGLWLWSFACALPPAEPPPPPPLTLRGAPIAFADWFAPSAPVAPASPGAWRATLDASTSAFITAERSFTRSAAAESTLTLSADGAARGCAQGHTTNRTSVGRYASEDGEDHVTDTESDVTVGFRGRWERSGGWLMVWVDALSHGACDPPDWPPQPHDGLLLCATLGPGGAMPSPLLGCHPVGASLTTLRGLVALPLGPSSPAALQSPGTELDGLSWWLLGGGEGVDIRWRHRSGERTPEVTITLAP